MRKLSVEKNGLSYWKSPRPSPKASSLLWHLLWGTLS